jgi:hypothetical protein
METLEMGIVKNTAALLIKISILLQAFIIELFSDRPSLEDEKPGRKY